MAENSNPNSNPNPQDNEGRAGYGYGYGGASYGGYYGGTYGQGYVNQGYQAYQNQGNHGYGGYGYGYGANAEEGGGKPVLSIRDYLLMIRERFWYLLLAVFICTTSFVLYTANKTSEFTGAAKLRLYRQAPTAVITAQKFDTENVNSGDDLGTQIALMRSMDIIERVQKRLPVELRRKVMEPYRAGNIFTGPLNDNEVMERCRVISPQSGTLIVNVSYTHPSLEVAVKMSELFAEEIRAANEENRLKVMNPSLEFSRATIANIKKELAEKQAIKDAKIIENPKLMELDAANLLMGDFMQRRATLAAEERTFREQERFWRQLEELREKKLPLTRFRSFSQSGQVPGLITIVTGREIALQTAKGTYGDNHPSIIEKETELRETRAKLAQAINEEVEKFEESYKTLKNNLELARQALDEKQQEIFALMKDREQLSALNREIADKDRTITNMEQAFFAERLRSNGGLLPSIDFLDRAFPLSTFPVNKDYRTSAIQGILAGTALGLAIIFMLAFFDDRVKSASDVEAYLQLPLVGILPIARRSSSFKKARLVETGDDKPVTEAFRSVYSSLRINETSRRAKTILVTSTSPSEGKSFVSTNLAITYALQGERVLLLDADLRLPVVAKTLQLEGDKGITKFLQGEIALEDAIHYSVATNLDVLPVGRPCSNPTQVLVGRRFAEMISTLKGIYDRIIVDSPPVGAVSDVLNLLPMVDGILYVVRFNTVKKRFIRSNIAHLRESKVPIFGAIMNHIGMRVVQYYTNSGDRSYHRYYTKTNKDAVNVALDE